MGCCECETSFRFLSSPWQSPIFTRAFTSRPPWRTSSLLSQAFEKVIKMPVLKVPVVCILPWTIITEKGGCYQDIPRRWTSVKGSHHIIRDLLPVCMKKKKKNQGYRMTKSIRLQGGCKGKHILRPGFKWHSRRNGSSRLLWLLARFCPSLKISHFLLFLPPE